MLAAREGDGGGHGRLLAMIFVANPRLPGTLFDLPSVVAGAPPLLAKAGVSDRCEAVSGDMFDAVPADGDRYVLSRVIHDWEDGRAEIVLGNCRRATRPGGPGTCAQRPEHDGADRWARAIRGLLRSAASAGGTAAGAHHPDERRPQRGRGGARLSRSSLAGTTADQGRRFRPGQRHGTSRLPVTFKPARAVDQEAGRCPPGRERRCRLSRGSRSGQSKGRDCDRSIMSAHSWP